MSDAINAATPATPAPEAPKPVRQRKAAKAAAEPDTAGVREWKDVVGEIKRLKDEGATVPAIAEQLEVSYTLVNQVILQSYKMTVDTVSLFERQERRRVEGE